MNLAKILFIATTVTAVIVASFLAGVGSAVTENAAYQLVGQVYRQIKLSFHAIGETSILEPKYFLQPARFEGAGVTINERDDGKLVLLSGFFEDRNELRLIRRDGEIVRRWPVSFRELFPDPHYMNTPSAPATDWNIDLHGAIVLPDGSVLFNFDYGGLVKLDRCGNVVWTVNHMTHHSIVPSERGGYWVPGRRQTASGESRFPPYEPPYVEDLILHVSDEGAILSEISVPELFYRNPAITAVMSLTAEDAVQDGELDYELVHVNKITELSRDLAPLFPEFAAGDLLLSLRDKNLLFVVDPETRVVKWWQLGPWIRQHDPEFKSNGTIGVFNNNGYKSQLRDGRSPVDAPRVSNIMEVDPATHRTSVVYGGKPGQEMFTVIRGKQQYTPEGGLFITEFEAGRAFETDANGKIVWEYVNRYDSSQVAEMTEAYLYDANYFTVSDWACERIAQ
jgi:hypothetical protein